MDVSGVLERIKGACKAGFQITRHFQDKCAERNLAINDVFFTLENNKIVGVEEQNAIKKLYKVIYLWDGTKDLHVVMRLSSPEKIKLITVFPSESWRRER